MNVRIVAQAVRTDERGWTSSVQVPMFFVEASDMEGACQKAVRVIDPHGILGVHIAAVSEDTQEYRTWKVRG